MIRWPELEKALASKRLSLPPHLKAGDPFWAEFRARASGIRQDTQAEQLSWPFYLWSRLAWGAVALLAVLLIALPWIPLRSTPATPATAVHTLDIVAPCTSAWILTLPSDTPQGESAIVIWVSGLEEENPS